MRNRARDYWDRFLNKPKIEIKKYLNKELALNNEEKLFKKAVEVINIETASACNRQCSYCPNSMYDRKSFQYNLNKQVWLKVINDLKKIEYSNTITLNLYNEPLLDESLLNKIAILREKLPLSYVNFNTNGDYLKKSTLEKLAKAGANEIRITLHESSGEYSDTVQIERFKNFFNKLEMQYIHPLIIPNTKMSCEFQYKSLKLILMSNNWNLIGNYRAGMIEKLRKNDFRKKPCMKPFREITIGHDGHAYICCEVFPNIINKNYRVGNMDGKNIFEIYTSSKLYKFRQNLFCFGQKK